MNYREENAAWASLEVADAEVGKRFEEVATARQPAMLGCLLFVSRVKGTSKPCQIQY